MKKIVLLIILMLGLFIIPNVYAEDIPESGVRYVVISANGEKFKTFDLEEAEDKTSEEELVFEGKTDANGEISLEGWTPNTELRVVDVKTNKEYTVTMGTQNFKIERNEVVSLLSNPKTSAPYIVVILILLIMISTTIVLKKKKSAVLLSVLLCVFTLTNVQASGEKIQVVDKYGTGIKNQEIKIYAKPTLSFEEVKYIFKYDLTNYNKETFEGNYNLPDGQYYTFLDGSNKKNITFKWDYINNEWVPENENEDEYIYTNVVKKESQWISNVFYEYEFNTSYMGSSFVGEIEKWVCDGSRNCHNQFNFYRFNNDGTISNLGENYEGEIDSWLFWDYACYDYRIGEFLDSTSYQDLLEDGEKTLYAFVLIEFPAV